MSRCSYFLAGTPSNPLFGHEHRKIISIKSSNRILASVNYVTSRHSLVSNEASIELQPTWPRSDVEFQKKEAYVTTAHYLRKPVSS